MMAASALDRLQERSRKRTLCGRCQKKPHDVRVRVEVREKAVSGSGRMIETEYASLCAACAEAVLTHLKKESR